MDLSLDDLIKKNKKTKKIIPKKKWVHGFWQN